MCGESGRSIRAVMGGFDVLLRPSMGRAGIAKGRPYLRSRIYPRNHQIAIKRTWVHRYNDDETRPIRGLVYQKPIEDLKRRIKVLFLMRPFPPLEIAGRTSSRGPVRSFVPPPPNEP